MRRVIRILAASVFTLSGLVGVVGTAAEPAPTADKPTAKAADAPAKTADPAKVEASTKTADSPAKPELSAEQSALRDGMRRTMALYFRQPINTADNTPSQVIQFCLAFGCDTEIRYGNAAGSAMNGIGCLCWNYPCAGYQLLVSDEGRIVARIGYGMQEQPSQLLATLAQAGVPAEYEMRVGERKGKVSDLVAAEKLDCLAGADLSLKLIGMAFYVENGQQWKSRDGEDWSVERLVKEELSRTPAEDNCDVANRLLGLSYSVERRLRRKEPVDGQFKRAEEYVAECQQFAFRLQNADGTWHPQFFAARGTGNDVVGSLRSTGYIAEWLALSLPQNQLGDRRLVRTFAYLANTLEDWSNRWNATAATPREVEAAMHAVHALRIYDRRVFKPYDRVPTGGPAIEPIDASTSP